MKINKLIGQFCFLLCTAIILIACNSQTKENQTQISRETLAQGFITPADSVQTAVYWYWISDNISKDGVVKDLHAMKKAGINRAFIGNIGLDDVAYGKVKMLSEEWWEILHIALKTATELNIEIGIFNSPGWSQSGGPWVKSENAMRYLTASETKVKGPLKISQKLEINFAANDPFTARSLSIKSTNNSIYSEGILQAKNAQGKYVTVKEFVFNRVNDEISVGFIPYAPLLISFPAVTAKNFRLKFKSAIPSGWGFPQANKKEGLVEVKLSAAPRVENYAQKTFAKMYHTPLPSWSDYQWAQQDEVENKELLIDASKVLDVSENMTADGMLNWDVPEGDWIILRTGMTPTGTKNSPASPEATGYEVDKMSKEHTALHFDGHIGEILRRIPEADRKCFKVVVQDSYEKGGQNFTDGFLDQFKGVYGYDPLPYLPVYQGMVVNSQQASDRFLWDMRRLVANKIAYDYVGGLRDISHENGLTTWLENYGHWGFPGEFLMYGGQSDEIGGEFWSEGTLGDIENRAATSCGHIYGKSKIWAESNTSGGRAFSRYPAMLKQRGDRFFAEGINATLLHVYIHQPYEDKNPGINAGFGNPFNRKNTWFSQMDVYTQYLKRTNYMLQQGLNVADVAYFIGEDTPKMTGVTDPALPIGYQFDYMNAEVIERDMTVENGLITLPHGTQYKIMVLPKLETMRPELLAKMKKLVNEGMVILGPAPMRSPSLQNQPQADQHVQEMAAELWGDVDGINVKSHKYGKGRVLNGMDMAEALALINVAPDCKLPDDNLVHYGHRTLGDQEIYFLTNQTEETQVISPEFRVSGKQPELWEATTGYIRLLPAYKQKENITIVPLKLAPSESVFVVFSKTAGKAKATGIAANYPKPELISNFNTPWTVNFDAAQRGPEKAVVFETLTDWSTSADERIKYYSGTAFYNNTFKIDQRTENKKIIIDLGALTAMAKVSINGNYVGGVWTAPCRLDISDFVKVGENQLKIEVVNTWVNRIIGDMKLPVEERQTWASHLPYNAESPLQPSGLFGSVEILTLND
jgi:hypothetical protein